MLAGWLTGHRHFKIRDGIEKLATQGSHSLSTKHMKIFHLGVLLCLAPSTSFYLPLESSLLLHSIKVLFISTMRSDAPPRAKLLVPSKPCPTSLSPRLQRNGIITCLLKSPWCLLWWCQERVSWSTIWVTHSIFCSSYVSRGSILSPFSLGLCLLWWSCWC